MLAVSDKLQFVAAHDKLKLIGQLIQKNIMQAIALAIACINRYVHPRLSLFPFYPQSNRE